MYILKPIEPETIEKIARLCHEANKVWCEMNGDDTQKHWEEAEQWQRDSAIKGVQFVVDNPFAGDSAQHESWMKEKIEQGWIYGEVKDTAVKTHPCLVPFNDLPEFQYRKDGIFRAIVLAMITGNQTLTINTADITHGVCLQDFAEQWMQKGAEIIYKPKILVGVDLAKEGGVDKSVIQRVIPEFLYHITSRNNFDKILNEGLLPNTNNNGIFGIKGEQARKHWHTRYGTQPIFLTTDYRLVIDTQAGDIWMEKNDAVLLKIDTANLFLEDEFDYLKEKWDKQYISYESAIKAHPLGVHYICRHPIPKEAIEQVW